MEAGKLCKLVWDLCACLGPRLLCKAASRTWESTQHPGVSGEGHAAPVRTRSCPAA